jgi:tetratricopeptide (TPR) repeat protein
LTFLNFGIALRQLESAMPSFAVRFWVTALCFAALTVTGCGGAESRKARHIERGRQYLAAGNFEKARVEFRNALQIAPTDSVVRYENGVVDAKLGNQREAAEFYQGAIDADADDVPARAALGRMYLYGGQPNRALDTIKPSIDKHPDDSALLVVRAAARNSLNDSVGALEDARRAVDLAPTSEDAVAVLAGIYQSQNQGEQARALVEGAIKRLPDSADLRVMLVQIYASLGLQPQVEALLLELTHLKPNDKAHRIRLAQFYSRVNRPDDAERALRDGIKAIPDDRDLKVALIDFLAARRSRADAAKELAAMIAASPNDYELQFEQAQFDEQGQDFSQAEAVYRQIIEHAKFAEPGITARNRLAALKVRQNDLAGAQTLVTEVLANNPRDDDALILRGNMALAQKDPKTAIADLRAVLRDQPNSIGVMRSLARAHVANGEPVLAEEIMRRALEANPKDATLQLDFAELLTELGRPAQAKPIIDELAKQQPNNTQVLDRQYKIAVATNDMVTARAAADAFVATQPKWSVGYFFQGAVAEATQHPEDAVKLYSKSLEMQPDAVEPLRAMARVLVTLKRTPEAITRLDSVIANYPKNPAAAMIKGDLLLRTERPNDAALAFKLALDRDPKMMVAYRNLAAAELLNHDETAAIATLRAGIDKVSDPESLETQLAAVYDSLKRPDDALAVYESALQRDPQADLVANNLAMLLVTYRTDKASLDRAAKLSARFAESPNPNFLDTYGWVLYKHGDATAALVALRNVLAKAPQSPIIWYHLGMAQVLAGQADAARDSLSRALKSGKEFPGMAEAKATLDKLAAQAPTNAVSPKS